MWGYELLAMGKDAVLGRMQWCGQWYDVKVKNMCHGMCGSGAVKDFHFNFGNCLVV